MSIPFDTLDVDQRDEVLMKLQEGLAQLRREYRLAGEAITPAEGEARVQRATQGRLAMLQRLDQLGLIEWYQNQ